MSCFHEPFSKLKSQMEVGHKWVGGGKRWIWHQLLKNTRQKWREQLWKLQVYVGKAWRFQEECLSAVESMSYTKQRVWSPEDDISLLWKSHYLWHTLRHYITPHLIPRFQLHAFFVKDEAAIHPEAQEMHFETVNKEGRGGAPKNRKYGWTKVRGGIPITTIIAQWIVDFNLFSGMLMASLWSTYPSDGLWRRLLYNCFWIVKTGCFSGSAKASEL